MKPFDYRGIDSPFVDPGTVLVLSQDLDGVTRDVGWASNQESSSDDGTEIQDFILLTDVAEQDQANGYRAYDPALPIQFRPIYVRPEICSMTA